jgi:hypothetical protein
MEAKELRIGSYVNYFNDGKHSIISNIDWGYAHLNDASSIDYELIKPIPLTEEWLVNFGFVKDGKYTHFTKNISHGKDFILDYSTKSNDYFLCDTHVDTNIKHVHQLQNLYFALTQKELTYKL